jgi:hypothetical protein
MYLIYCNPVFLKIKQFQLTTLQVPVIAQPKLFLNGEKLVERAGFGKESTKIIKSKGNLKSNKFIYWSRIIAKRSD